MFCIYCHNATTSVTNSRPHKKEPRVWRRRHCRRCGKDFTTQEKPVLDAKIYVLHAQSGKKEPFYQGKLLYSIIKCFAHDEAFGIMNALPLSDTVIAALLPIEQPLTTQAITATCHEVLLRFDQTAAAQYALAHGKLNPPRRRRKSA